MIANIEGFDESHEWLPRRLRNPSKATEIHWKVKGTHRKQQESLGKLKESQLKQMDFLESTRNPG